MQLTKDAKRLICLLYNDYLQKLKHGSSKSDAKFFGSSHNIHQTLCPNLLFEDVDDTCRELSRAGFINCLWADNIAYSVHLSDDGIIYMENRFKKGLLDVTDFITKFF